MTPEKKSMQPYGGEDNKGPASAETQDRPEKPLVKDFTYYTIIMVMFLITAAFCMVSHITSLNAILLIMIVDNRRVAAVHNHDKQYGV